MPDGLRDDHLQLANAHADQRFRNGTTVKISLSDQVAWITGGGEGIGRAIAIEAARSGAKVAVTGRDPEPLQKVVQEISDEGGECIAVPGDVSRNEEMQQAVDRVVDRYGKLQIVVANAGINGTWAPIESLTPEEWSQTIDVNLTGTFLTLRAAVPRMKEAGGGSVVVVASVNGTRVFSNEGASAYAVSKAGQVALAKMLALELAPAKIRVNVICPGAIDTGIHDETEKRRIEEIETPVEFPEGNIPLTGGEMGKPEQVANLAVFLASDAAGHITGTPVWVDGAESLIE